MRALRFCENNLTLDQNAHIPICTAGMAIVQIHYAALNRRDQWIVQGAYPNIQSSILGSDGCGIVVQGSQSVVGKEVIICPSLGWGENEQYQSREYEILGMPNDGTFSEYCLVPEQNLIQKPTHLSSKQAAALPLAGLTAWRALMTKGHCTHQSRILVTGAGGGVAMFACQLAIASGAEVWVTSSSNIKIQTCLNLGAHGGVNYTEKGWEKKLPQNFDIVIDGAGGAGFGSLVRLIGMGGRIVFYGGTKGAWPAIRPQHLFFKQAQIMGSTMGSPQEFVELCRFVEMHRIIPMIDSCFAIEQYSMAFDALSSKNRIGKVIISCSQ